MAEMTLDPQVIEIPEIDYENIVTEDDQPVDNIFSERQQRLITETLYATSWQQAGTFVALANVGLFYDINKHPVVPDALVSLDVQLPDELWQKKHRSYFIWEYGKPPEVVIEVVSNRKGGELDKKRALYARIGIAYYIVFDPAQQLSETKLYLFELRGRRYVAMEEAWLSELGLGLTLWEGEYEGSREIWLRWVDQDSQLLLTGVEAAGKERERAEQEHQRAEQERERAERLVEQLRALGVEPDA